MTTRPVFTRTVAWACLPALLLACGDSSPTDPAGTGIDVLPMEGLQGFEARLDSLRVVLRIPGIAAAIAQDGEIVWSMGFGYAEAEDERPATPSTPFHLASLTKPFAATIVMQLVEQGLVSLDDPVSQYGVDLEADGVIRVRHLLTHTSHGVPGSSYRYAGDRFGQLDRVIQGAAGRSFGELLVERILGPIQLRETAPNPRHPDFYLTGLNYDQFMAAMAAGYELRNGRVVPIGHPTYFGTAAGLVASAEDMARFSIAIDEGRLLAPETWDSVFTPAVSNSGARLPYGLGWFIYEYQGAVLQWHYGLWDSNSSLIVRAPQARLTFVVLANTNMLSRAYGLGVDANVMRSDVARLFVESYVIGDEPLPAGRWLGEQTPRAVTRRAKASGATRSYYGRAVGATTDFFSSVQLSTTGGTTSSDDSWRSFDVQQKKLNDAYEVAPAFTAARNAMALRAHLPSG